MSLTNEQECPVDGTQKNWTKRVYVKTDKDSISRMDDKRSTTATTTTNERLNSLCIKKHVLKGGINDFYRVKRKFQAQQMFQEHLINQVQVRFISKKDTRL